MLDEGVVQAVQDIDLCMLLGAGWPFWLGGISPYLDRTGVSEAVRGARFLPRGVASLPAVIGTSGRGHPTVTQSRGSPRAVRGRCRGPVGRFYFGEGRAGLQEGLEVAEHPRPAAATHRPELVVARRHREQGRHAGQLVRHGEPADAVLPRPLDRGR